MNLTISTSHLTAARKLLTRLRFERFTLPVLTHVLATIDAAGLSLAVTDLDHWLETRIPAIIGPSPLGRFLIPAEALKVAARGDKGSSAHFAYQTTGNFCLIMSLRFIEETTAEDAASETQVAAPAIAA